MEDYKKQFLQAVQNGAGAPASSNQALANSFAGAFNDSSTKGAYGAFATSAAQNADDDRKAREAARQAQIQKLQDGMDPSKYQKLRKDDGGFQFLSPDGKEIDIDTYAKRTGQRRVDVLKDSENPLDQQFIYDWSQMNDLNQAIWSNNTEAMDTFPQEFRSLTPEQINKKLLEKYPHIYGMGNYEKSYSNLGKPVFRASDEQNQRSQRSSGGQGGQRSGLALRDN